MQILPTKALQNSPLSSMATIESDQWLTAER
jgi:hypothetical protein